MGLEKWSGVEIGLSLPNRNLGYLPAIHSESDSCYLNGNGVINHGLMRGVLPVAAYGCKLSSRWPERLDSLAFAMS
jgi:hypothetical protein